MASSSKQLGVGGWEDQTSWAPEVLRVEPGNPLPEVQQTVDDHQFHYLQSPQSQWSPTVSSTYGCADNGHPLPAPGQGVHAHGQGQGRLTQGSTPSAGPLPSLPGPIAPCRSPILNTLPQLTSSSLTYDCYTDFKQCFLGETVLQM